MFRLIAYSILALALPVTAQAAPAKPVAVPAVTSAQFAAILKPYLALHASLVAGDPRWARAHATALATAAAPAPALAKVLAGFPADIAGQRKRFGSVSSELIALAGQFADLTKGYNVVYCAMAPGSWLQRGTHIKNPYYGASMLDCGELHGQPGAAKTEAP